MGSGEMGFGEGFGKSPTTKGAPDGNHPTTGNGAELRGGGGLQPSQGWFWQWGGSPKMCWVSAAPSGCHVPPSSDSCATLPPRPLPLGAAAGSSCSAPRLPCEKRKATRTAAGPGGGSLSLSPQLLLLSLSPLPRPKKGGHEGIKPKVGSGGCARVMSRGTVAPSGTCWFLGVPPRTHLGWSRALPHPDSSLEGGKKRHKGIFFFSFCQEQLLK